MLPTLDFEKLRDETVGVDLPIETAFGQRLMLYCDYTASGRSLLFVERYLQALLRGYANTHTEDDATGRSMSRLLHQAEAMIKQAVNAGPGGKVIACGTGATGAIDKLQQLLGIRVPPATRERIGKELEACFGEGSEQRFSRHLGSRQPVVFIGPYEHHSNEISWRHGLATVVTVGLAADGSVDLGQLEQLLLDPKYKDRPRIGSFSAASNVTGIRTQVHEIAALLHQHDALACFDYAASAPYVEINMNPGGKDSARSIDAIFVSPHKFLGGPGASGILVFNEKLYRRDLPPSVAAGGTVDYVSPEDQDFIADIEEREKAGTPGILQTLRAALVFEIKRQIGAAQIEAREHQMLERAFARWRSNNAIEILGNPDPSRRVGIVSFNLRDPRGGYLHPKLVTALLNDLFGIQSRAGCSCAGPYGHRLLDIDIETSERYREWVRQGYQGIKPGWCRVGFHFAMDDVDVQYLIDAVDCLACCGHRFLPLYDFDPVTGLWKHREYEEQLQPLSLAAALDAPGLSRTALPPAERQAIYRSYLDQARQLANGLGEPPACCAPVLDGRFAELQFFSS